MPAAALDRAPVDCEEAPDAASGAAGSGLLVGVRRRYRPAPTRRRDAATATPDDAVGGSERRDVDGGERRSRPVGVGASAAEDPASSTVTVVAPLVCRRRASISR